jgi:peptidyl-prolyl cis-trans isomerase D
MFKTLQQRNLAVKIVIGVVLGLISIAMVITLVPGSVGSISNNPDVLASVGGQEITMAEVHRTLDRVMRGQNLPKVLQGLYTKQIVDQLIFDRALDLEAERLGLRVSAQEQTDRIQQILPSAWQGGNWVGKTRYTEEVEQRTGLSVEEFEEQIRKSLLEEKIRQLVTDGVIVTPGEIEQEFRRRNEKVKIEYVLVKPADLAAGINPTDAELAAYFSKNQSRYPIPERRSGRYAVLEQAQLRQRATVSDEDLRNYYNQHLNEYRVEDRVHVEHILFKTVGKTDAEVAEIRQKAEDALKKAKHGDNFEELAKKYSDDTSKDKGGDLGWIVRGQTVPEFEKAAFTLPKGAISDLVQTQYGFHIIKVLDRETAHTKSLDEVRLSILTALSDEKAVALENDVSNQMARAVRESNRQKIDDLAKKFGLQVGDVPPVSVSDPVGDLGNARELHETLFHLNPGELSAPLRVERGVVILTVKDVLPAHPATLAEVHDKVLADLRQEKSGELAHSRAEELARKAKSGEALAQAAKSLGIEAKTSDAFARNGSVAGVGSGSQLGAAFNMPVGQTSDPTLLDGNWLVYSVVSKDQPNPQDLAQQLAGIEQQLLETKRSTAFQAFREALEDRMKADGKVVINNDLLKRLTSPT